ncbi:hypothetical protein SESBI_12371 [Sesbania bispinosa]|nr:hypothetical protein SESBI_12371 [Sesbania bispinosa]
MDNDDDDIIENRLCGGRFEMEESCERRKHRPMEVVGSGGIRGGRGRRSKGVMVAGFGVIVNEEQNVILL